MVRETEAVPAAEEDYGDEVLNAGWAEVPAVAEQAIADGRSRAAVAPATDDLLARVYAAQGAVGR